MIANTLRTRSIVFAYLFGPPRVVEREEAYKIHRGVCDDLKCDDLSFQYQNPEAQKPGSRAFILQFRRKEGRGGIAVTIDNQGMQTPIRLLLEYHWPPSVEHVTETMDSISEAAFQNIEGTWTRVLAEARIRAQCSVPNEHDSATGFMRADIFHLPGQWFDAFGSIKHLSAQFITPAGSFGEDPIENPYRELTIETLHEDSKGIYLEIVSRWPQLSEGAIPAGGIDLFRIRPIGETPSRYIEDTYTFMQKCLNSLKP